MSLYIVLGQSSYPMANQLFTETDIEEIKKLPQSANWSFVPVNPPWEQMRWSRAGGRGESPYPKGVEQTTIRLPKEIAYQVQQYAVWLSQQRPADKLE